MPKAPLFSKEGERIGEVDLNDRVFGDEIRESLLHSAVVMQLASRRQGNAATKTRGKVRGGGRKPYRQKGTGRARQGSIRSPLYPGGGTVFGPAPRSYSYKIPKSARPVALRSALSAKAADEEIAVIEDIVMGEPKTKLMKSLLSKICDSSKVLVITGKEDGNVTKSLRNLQSVSSITSEGINVYDLLNCDRVLFTKEALSAVEEVLG